MASAVDISEFLQAELSRRGKPETSAIEGAAWLDRAGLLKDRVDRPGAPLRDLLREGQIDGAEQRPPSKNGRWFITARSGSVPSRKPLLDLTENDVVDAVCAEIESWGGRVIVRATTMQQGRDIVAELGDLTIAVEAKGATSSKEGTNRFGQRFSSSQITTHVAKAFFTAAATTEVTYSAMAFPDTRVHRARIANVKSAVDELGLGVFWVTETGKVQLEAPWVSRVRQPEAK